MVSHYRLRAVLLPLMLYGVTGAVGSYFVWHAVNGERGLKAKSGYKRRMAALGQDLAALKAEHAQWAHRVELIGGENIDRDLLDEEARLVLGRAGKGDLVVLLPQTEAR